MFTRFYPDSGSDSADLFAQTVLALKEPVSAAQIQGYFMLHKDSGMDAIKYAQNIFSS